MNNLTNIIKETYTGLGEELKINEGCLTSVKLKLEKNIIFYYIKNYDGEVLVTNEISILPDQENEEIFKKIIEKNEIIANKLGIKQINTEALTDTDKGWLEKLGYVFEDEKYMGIKKLK